MKPFLSWWCAILAIAAVVYYAVLIGAVQHVLLGDITKITWITCAFAFVASAMIGKACWRVTAASDRALEFGLFAEDTCLRLGLLGTVTGCIIMFGSDLTSFSTADPAKTAALIQHISSSFGTAVGTTAVGIASSIVLKVQNAILQHAIDGLEK